jgi:DNA-binding IclR family transcriptional regulator
MPPGAPGGRSTWLGARMAGNSGRSPGRSVTSKVTAILDAFLPSPELSLNTLADRADLPLSTAYRLVTELVEWGGLERVDGRGYRVGLHLWEIGSRATRSTTVGTVAQPYMQDLYEATHENVQLAVLQGREALYVEKITGRRSMTVKTRRGGRLPLHATGVGKALLAHAPAELLDELLAAGLKRYTPHTIVAPGHLRRALTEVRRTGVAYAREEMTLGSVSVASPLFDSEGQVIAAMSIVMRSSRSDVKRLALAVRTAAICASRALRDSTLDLQPYQLQSPGAASSG